MICKHCGKPKHFHEFGFDGKKRADGTMNRKKMCKKCCSKAQYKRELARKVLQSANG